MPVIFRPVGFNRNFEIKTILQNNLTLVKIIEIFTKFGLLPDDFNNIRFIFNLETITFDRTLQINNEENTIVFVFTNDDVIKDKLSQIFSKYATNSDNVPSIFFNSSDWSSNPLGSNPLGSNPSGSNQIKNNCVQVDSELQKPIVDQVDEESYELTEEVINNMNLKTVKLFENENFKQLIRIFNTDPDIIKTFLSYVSHGDIVKLNIPSQLNKPDNYDNEMLRLKELGVTNNDNQILSTLEKYNGHLNLTLRDLLFFQ